MRKRSVLLLLLLVGIIPTIHSQKTTDLSGWLTTDIVLNHNRWDYTGSIEYRSKENMHKMDLVSMGLYCRYTFSNLFKVSAGYEIFLTNTATRGNIIEHRLMLQNESSFRIEKLKIDNRLSLLDDFEKMKDPAFGFRDRIRIKYPIQHFEPFTYVELYYRFKDADILHHKNRYGVGLNYIAHPRNQISIYYMREQYYQRTFGNNVIGIAYAYILSI